MNTLLCGCTEETPCYEHELKTVKATLTEDNPAASFKDDDK